MQTIEMIFGGNVIERAPITAAQWESIKNLDYIELEMLPEFVDCHGIVTVVRMLSLFPKFSSYQSWFKSTLMGSN